MAQIKESPNSSLHGTAEQSSTDLGKKIDARKRMVKKSAWSTILIAGIALFSDGYTAGIIGYMEPIFSVIYKGNISADIATRLANSFLIGEIFGMLFFGLLIDRAGRRAGVVGSTLFLVLGIVISAAAHGFTVDGMFWMMIIGRGAAGFGAGGEYSTCGTSATEAADENATVRKRRGLIVAISSITAIDLGFVGAGVVAIIVLAGYQNVLAEGIWRVCFGIGIVLPLGVFIFRFRMINSTQYQKHAIKHRIPYRLALKLYWKPLLGISLGWFCYDFVRYPFGLFSSTIVTELNPSASLIRNIGFGTLINCFYLPGTIIGGYLMDVLGRRQTVTLGFVCLGIMGFIIGGALYPLYNVFPLFIVLYGLFNAAGEMGPGAGVFLCGTEQFPTSFRGHFLGFAAAMGKVGAAVGTQVFNPIIASFSSVKQGQQAVFLIGSGFALAGGLASWFLLTDHPPELEAEDARFRRELVASGYDTSGLGEDLKANVKFSVYDAREIL